MSFYCNKSDETILDHWHKRLGHPANKVVKIVFSQFNEKLSVSNDFSFCHACQLGKSHKLSFPLSDTVYTTPL